MLVQLCDDTSYSLEAMQPMNVCARVEKNQNRNEQREQKSNNQERGGIGL